MQYTPHYNFNLPEGTDIVNPLVQDNPNYSAIDTALYDNKLRVVGTATHVKTGTNHAITLADSDINQFKFVATGDYATGDTFTVDGVTVTPRIADGSTIPNGAFKINSTVLCILDGTVLNLIGVNGAVDAADVAYDNSVSGLFSANVQGAVDEVASNAASSTNKLTYLICKRRVYTSGSIPAGGDIGISYPVPTGYTPLSVSGEKYFTDNGILSAPSLTTNGYSYTRWRNVASTAANLDGKYITFYYIRDDVIFE